VLVASIRPSKPCQASSTLAARTAGMGRKPRPDEMKKVDLFAADRMVTSSECHSDDEGSIPSGRTGV
jgi:hypothetical protein